MIGIASVLKELDKESVAIEETTLYGKFSVALTRFVHNIVSSKLLDYGLQVTTHCICIIYMSTVLRQNHISLFYKSSRVPKK